jgi:hypothetical protein
MSLRLPLPDTSKWGDFTDVLQNLQGQKLKREELAETSKYHAGQLEIQKQAEARAQQLMPYLMQKYKDEHGKEMSEMEMNNLYNGIIKDAYNQTGPAPQQQPSGMPSPEDTTNTNMMNQFIQGRGAGMPMPSGAGSAPAQGITPQQFSQLSPEQQQSLLQQAGGQYTFSGAPQAPRAPMTGPISRHQAVQAANASQAQYDATHGVMPGAPQAPQGIPQEAAPEDMGEQIVRPGNPNLSKLDAIAGLPKSPVKAPDVTYDRENGLMYTQYPSGKITRQRIPGAETPDKKEERAINKEEQRENRKEANKIEENTAELAKTASIVKEMKQILKQNPGITGISNLVGQKTKLAKGTPLHRFKFLAGELQAKLAKQASARAGIGIINWINDIKPSIYSTKEANLGMLDAAEENMESDYNIDSERYKRKSGTDIPIKFPKFSNTTIIIDPEGGEHEILESNLAAALKKYPGSREKGKS